MAYDVLPVSMNTYGPLAQLTVWPSSISSAGVHAASSTASLCQALPSAAHAGVAAALDASCGLLAAAVQGLPSTHRSNRQGS
jgi:hypothetical protein